MRTILLPGFLFTLLIGASNNYAQTGFEKQRTDMVTNQIEAMGITDKQVLETMRSVPRHEFVPANARDKAYVDSPVAIGKGQTISQPFIVAFMTSELKLKPTDRVLEIGTGSGYQAAVLSEIVDEVYTIEIVESLGLKARETLDRLGYGNVQVRIGDGYEGWPGQASFDAIIITAGVEEIPPPLLDQLAEGGRMIVPVGKKRSVRQLVLVKKKNGKYKMRNRMPVVFVEFTRN